MSESTASKASKSIRCILVVPVRNCQDICQNRRSSMWACVSTCQTLFGGETSNWNNFPQTSPVLPCFGASAPRHLHPSGHLRRRRRRAPAPGCEECLRLWPRRGHGLWAVHLQRTTAEGKGSGNGWSMENNPQNWQMGDRPLLRGSTVGY